MSLKQRFDISEIARNFQIFGDFLKAEPTGAGHINDTFVSCFKQAGTPVRFIHQRINHEVFKDPITLMDNLHRVTKHMKRKLLERNEEEVSRKTLTVIPSLDGTPYHQDLKGNFWRTFLFIENAQTFQAVQSCEQAFEAGKSFGHFQAVLDDLPSPRLIETIPDFHNTAKRFRALEKAVNRDSCNRAKSCRREIDFVLNRTAESTILIQGHHDGRIPERITHNDTKFNNLMLDEKTGLGICILDLDTVMPGLSLYDFGDMVRTTTSPAEEDEQDLSKVTMQMPMFEALVTGFLESIRDILTPTEIEYLAFSGRLITIELGARFLTDFLEGDVYFRTHRECHNLDRAKVQFKLVESMESQLDEMEQVVKAAVS